MTEKELHRLLEDSGDTLAVLKDGEVVFHSQERGLKPLYGLYKTRPELLKGALVADRVTGKAAAVLSVVCGAEEVYSDLISDHALQVLEAGGVRASYGEKVPYIVNRTQTGMCPMEALVLDADTPEEGVRLLNEFFQSK